MGDSYELVICQKCCSRRWPGLRVHFMGCWCTFACVLHDCACAIVLYECFVHVGFSSEFLLFLIVLKLPNQNNQFFTLLCFGIFSLYLYVSTRMIVWLFCWTSCVLAWGMYILDSFAFCSSFTDCFIVFSCQICHVC